MTIRVGLRASLDAVEKRKVCYPYLESNPDYFIF
jgi:hypothetical protein